jgi:hypothetical protein
MGTINTPTKTTDRMHGERAAESNRNMESNTFSIRDFKQQQLELNQRKSIAGKKWAVALWQ